MALDFLAGCLGGCAGVLVGHPFDTVKVRLQTQDFRNPQYRGTFHCFSSIVSKEKVTGLYKGLSSPMAGVAIVNAIVFGVYGNIQRRQSNPDALTSHLVAGATAGFAQSFVCSPMELAKTRLQLQQTGSTAVYKNPLDCFVRVARNEGWRGIFKGLGITMTREVPGCGVYFLSYELMTRRQDGASISTLHMLLAGGLSGTFSWVLTYPVDVIKSRLQADGVQAPCRYNGVVDCYRQSVKAEGYSFLTRGLTSTILRAFPTNAATFAVVTWVFRLANTTHVEEDLSSNYQLLQEVTATASIGIAQSTDPKVIGFKPYDYSRYLNNSIFKWRKVLLHNCTGGLFDGVQGFAESGQLKRVVTSEVMDAVRTAAQDNEVDDGNLEEKEKIPPDMSDHDGNLEGKEKIPPDMSDQVKGDIAVR